jgi:hypothetical protein
MLALGGATIMLTALQLSWLPQTAGHDVALVILVFTVPLQLLAAVFGYLSRDGAGGTGMALLSSCWLAVGVMQLRTPPAATNPTLGLLLFFAAAALMVPVMASALGKVLASVVFFLAASRFVLTGVYEYHGGHGWEHASGWLGLALCVTALYAAIAFEAEDIQHRTVLPVGRWGAGKRAMRGNLITEVQKVEQEAGVREQL